MNEEEQISAHWISVGALKAALECLERAEPRGKEARELWHVAVKATRKTYFLQWEFAQSAKPAIEEDKRKLVHALGYIMTNPVEAVRVAREALSMVSPQTNPSEQK